MGKQGKDGGLGPVLLLLAVTPLGSLGSQTPCLLLLLPSCSQGLRSLTGQRAARQGDPAPCHQVPLPVPATASGHPTQRAQTGTPMSGVGRPHRLQTAIGKRSLALTLDPQPLQGTAASSTGPETVVCLSPGGAHQENSREQTFASCSGLGFSSGALAASCRTGPVRVGSVEWGQPVATRRCEGRLQAPLIEEVREPQGAGHRTPGAHGLALGCKLYQRARSETGSPPRRRRRGRLQQKRPSAGVKTQRKLAKGDSSPPSGHAALIRTKQGRCGKVFNWNGAGPWRVFLGETPPHREIP